ncbi:MAG: hypothetical protein KFB93_08720 [Simkaniaceae bacterium]|jgi:hypothetical protein|nr:MAG: hypothetical protein KFB93_08720 [Simkaniaceae bacterium]
MSVLKELKPLSPAAFFDVRTNVLKADKKRSFKKGLLPDGTGLTGDGCLAKVALLWSPTGLFLEMLAKLAIDEGDFLELFIDTRDLKNSNVMTRFCHHFIFYPEEEVGIEVTRFRGDDSHEIADPSLFSVKTTVKRSSYLFEIGIPKEALYGYDPAEFKRLGFTYRFQKKNGEKMHFNLSSDFFHIEKHPALWASLNLSEEK